MHATLAKINNGCLTMIIAIMPLPSRSCLTKKLLLMLHLPVLNKVRYNYCVVPGFLLGIIYNTIQTCWQYCQCLLWWIWIKEMPWTWHDAFYCQLAIKDEVALVGVKFMAAINVLPIDNQDPSTPPHKQGGLQIQSNSLTFFPNGQVCHDIKGEKKWHAVYCQLATRWSSFG